MDLQTADNKKSRKLTLKQHNTRRKNSLRQQSKSSLTSIVCPVCTVTIRGSKEFNLHYQKEVDQMNQIHLSKRKHKVKPFSSFEEIEDPVTEKTVPSHERDAILNKIKKRKYERYANMFLLSMSKNKNVTSSHISTGNSENIKAESTYDLMQCAICNEFLESSTHETSSRHLAKCFAKNAFDQNLYSSSDDDDTETVEEFSWAGQTWVRTSSLFEADYLPQEGRLTRLEMEDCDELLDVDGDQEEPFGQQQFIEADVIPCVSDIAKSQKLREAVCGGASSLSSFTSNQWNADEDIDESNFEKLFESCNNDKDKFIEALKIRTRNLEQKLDTDVSKCSICMGPFKNPVVSTNCWHVCCSECWMRALGAKKLCPKCNNIVSVSQLRKIFL